MINHITLAVFIVIFASISNAATYYVNVIGGNNSNDGSQGSPWLTIQHGENTATDGDVVRVQTGTYNERVSINNPGITFIGDGTAIMRGFDFAGGGNNTKIINFEIFHTNSTWSRAITFSGNQTNIEISGNYIHNTYNSGGAIRAISTSSTNSYITIRGNTFYYLGYVEGVYTLGNSMAVQTEEWNQFWLIEYNTVNRAGDFMDVDSWNTIIRNNWIHNYADAYWTSGAGHADIFQPFSISNQVYEANICGDNIEANSHYLQIRQNDTYGTNLIFRGNVGYNHGSYVAQLSGADRLRLYNNTFYDFCNVSAGTPVGFDDEPGTGEGATDGLLRNNIFHTMDASVLVSVCASCSATIDNNLSFNGPTTGGGVVSTSDPLFNSTTALQFWLQGGSPALSLGVAITTISSATGSGTSFDVVTSKDFTDGMGLVVGDLITLENGSSRTITGISGNTITVDSSVSWTNGDDVFWGPSNDPPLGAFPANYTRLTSATYTLSGTVTPNGDTRNVRQFRGGIQVAVDNTSPYTFTHVAGDTYKAYALYAQTNAVILATEFSDGVISIGTVNTTTLHKR